MDRQNVAYLCTGILFNHKRNEVLTHDAIWVNSENIVVTARSVTKDIILYDYIHMKFQNNLWRPKVLVSGCLGLEGRKVVGE